MRRKLIALLMVALMVFQVSPVQALANTLSDTQSSYENNLRDGSVSPYASGLTAGPWFGSGSSSWDTNIVSWVKIAGPVASVIAAFVPNAEAKALAAKIAAVCSLLAVVGGNPEYIYGNVSKRYREYKYSDGTFAYFETEFKVISYLRLSDGTTESLGTEYERHTGSMPLNIPFEVQFLIFKIALCT